MNIVSALVVAVSIGLIGCAPQSAGRFAPTVDPSVMTVRSCGPHRIIVQRICNPSHCRTNAFLQSDEGDGVTDYPINEINDHVSPFVAAANGLYEDGVCSFVLAVVEPHTGDSLFTLRVEPRAIDGYVASKLQQPNKGGAPDRGHEPAGIESQASRGGRGG